MQAKSPNLTMAMSGMGESVSKVSRPHSYAINNLVGKMKYVRAHEPLVRLVSRRGLALCWTSVLAATAFRSVWLTVISSRNSLDSVTASSIDDITVRFFPPNGNSIVMAATIVVGEVILLFLTAGGDV
uniref:DUF202 domain-containing protein n=1 Tax=Ascaris lumbricoides TaxID=6252 RepID=A0A0M3INP7_ASCLU